MLVEDGVLGSVHTANLRAVRHTVLRIARAGALDEDHLLGNSVVGRTDHLTAGRTGGGKQPLELKPIHYIGMRHVGVSHHRLILVKCIACGDDDSPHFHLDGLGSHIIVNGLHITRLRALPARQREESQAGIGVECVDRRHRLGVGNIDRAAGGQSSVELIGHDDWTDLGAIVTSGALLLNDVAGVAQDARLKIPRLSLDFHHLAQREQPDVRMLPDFNHARRENTLRTIQRREGLGKLRHVTADGRFLLNQDDLVTAVGDIQRSLHSADASTDHQSPIIHQLKPQIPSVDRGGSIPRCDRS